MSISKFLHYPVSNLTKKEVVNLIIQHSSLNSVAFITVMNANKMYLYDHYHLCKKSIDESIIVLPENAINLGMKLIGIPLKEWDMGGIELAKELLTLTSLNIYLLGSHDNVLNLILTKTRYSKNIVGFHNGYFNENELPQIITNIKESNASIILLGLGSPKQEELMQKFASLIDKGIFIGVGGTFDVLSGLKKDAPKWTKRGFEWLYRAIQDPKKFKRYIVTNLYFLKQLLLFYLRIFL